MIRSMIFCFKIWVLSALLAGISVGSFYACFFSGRPEWAEGFMLVLFCTLICSAPAMFIIWLIALSNRHSAHLFRIVLKAMLLLSAASCTLLFILPLGEPASHRLGLAACVVLSALSSVMLHHHTIVSYNLYKNNSHV